MVAASLQGYKWKMIEGNASTRSHQSLFSRLVLVIKPHMPQDDLQDGDEWDGDHHTDDAEKLPADEDTGNDRDGMHIDDAAHEFGHEEMTVELLDDDVEDDDFRHDACPLKQSE